MLGAGTAFATVMATFRYTNGLQGYGVLRPDDDEEVERREAQKKLRRRPLSETIEQLGEGRGGFPRIRGSYLRLTLPGIYAPGWEERRRKRLLAKYGVDVNAAQESS